MIVFEVTNVPNALATGVERFKEFERAMNTHVSSRAGLVIEAPEPVTTVYLRPQERVLFSPSRDANPFFHFFEALWMLAGRNDLEFLRGLNKQMAAYSDDGLTLWGAYGHRWRSFFGCDQLAILVGHLRAQPDTRRAVLTMWSVDDLSGTADGRGGLRSKDVPCNTHVYFKIRRNKLQMTICNRSNDMLWGAYGANAVHMSMLMEYVAGKVGVSMGQMTQVSDSLHVYLDDKGGALWERLKATRWQELWYDPYFYTVRPYSMWSGEDGWDADLFRFMDLVTGERVFLADKFRTNFFKNVATPIWRGWLTRSVEELKHCAAEDWKIVCTEWLNRRSTKETQ